MIIINYRMLNLIKYILFIILAACFYSCGSEYSKITKNNNSLFFHGSNQIKKEIILNDNNQIVEIKIFNDNNLYSQWIPNRIELKDSIEYYGNGKIKTKGYLKNGKKHSLWSYFDRDGHLLIERYFSYGKPSHIWIWYDHHNHHHIKNFEIYEDFRGDGKLTRFYQSGRIKEVKHYANNKLDGEYNLFNNDQENSLQYTTNYLLGKKNEDN